MMTNHLTSSLRRGLLACALVSTAVLLAGCGGGGTVPSGGVSVRALPADYATRKAVAYSPFRTGNRDTETVTAAMVQQDLGLLEQAKFGLLRLFDSSDNVSKLVLQTIRDQKLDLKVHLGIYVLGNNASFNSAEIARGIALAKAYPDIVEAVSVGNETMVSWSFNAIAPATMTGYLKQVRDAITQPVTTDDNWAFWAAAPTTLLQQVDFVALHTYALLDTVSAPGSWDWQQTGVAASGRAVAMMDASITKSRQDYSAARTYLDGIGYTFLPIVIGETGWKAVATGGETQRAHPVNQKLFVDRLAAWKASAGGPLNVIYFEAFDEPWKGGDDGWGLFNVNRQARYVVQALVPSAAKEPGTWTDADALYYVPPVVHGPVTASTYTVYADTTTPGEALPSEALVWNAWQSGQTSNIATVTAGAPEGTQAAQINPTPLSWGWGMTLSFTNSAEDLTAFQTAGTLRFSIKTTYPGKLEIGFLTGTANASSLYDVYIPIAPGDYGYQNDGQWHDVAIPISAITPHGAMAFGMTDPTKAKLDLSKVTNPFVIADRYGVTGKADSSNITTAIQVDHIRWTK